ncbi:MAG: helix-turn-helix transcriptional regulator [Candidatus Methanomethylicia archaeon]
MFEHKVKEALKFEKSIKIIDALLRFNGLTNFSNIERTSGVKGGALKHHLNRLGKLGIVNSDLRGFYKLKYKGVFYTILNLKKPYTYLGLLGRRNNREEPETLTALKLLKMEGIEYDRSYVITTSKALGEWENIDVVNCNFILCSGDEISDVNALRSRVKSIVEDIIENYPLIMDCTGATKPATIAFYDIASLYLIPLMYVTEDKKIKWIIDLKSIVRKVKHEK